MLTLTLALALAAPPKPALVGEAREIRQGLEEAHWEKSPKLREFVVSLETLRMAHAADQALLSQAKALYSELCRNLPERPDDKKIIAVWTKTQEMSERVQIPPQVAAVVWGQWLWRRFQPQVGGTSGRGYDATKAKFVTQISAWKMAALDVQRRNPVDFEIPEQIETWLREYERSKE